MRTKAGKTYAKFISDCMEKVRVRIIDAANQLETMVDNDLDRVEALIDRFNDLQEEYHELQKRLTALIQLETFGDGAQSSCSDSGCGSCGGCD